MLIAVAVLVIDEPGYSWVELQFVLFVLLLSTATRTISLRYAIAMFATGVSIATGITLLIGNLLDASGYNMSGVGIRAVTLPVVEELTKLLPVLVAVVIIRRRTRVLPNPSDLLVRDLLAPGELGDIGGRLEYESFEYAGDSGNAFQGVFRAKAVSFETRYSRLNDASDTRTIALGLSVNPGWTILGTRTTFRTGPDVFFSGLFSRSDVADLGSLDYGGGWWASTRADVSDQVSLGFGGVVLGSKSYIPTSLVEEGSDWDWAVRNLNNRGIQWDGTYGGHVQVRPRPRLSVGLRLSSPVP